jgi:phosphopantetheinyl transferase
VLAVSLTRPVGIDLEQLRDLPDAKAVAAEMFSAEEQSAWASLPVAQQTRAFMRLWTRKEACLKAWGVGLGFDARRVDVGWAAGGLLIQPPDPLLDGPLWLESLSLPDNAGFEAAVALGTAGSTRRAQESLPESACRPFSSELPKGGSLLPITRP